VVEDQTWLEPIRAAAAAILADPPPLTDWDAEEDGESEIFNDDVERLLHELGWPTRTRTRMFQGTAFGPFPPPEPHEITTRYFPLSWHLALIDRIAHHVRVRDANPDPNVPERMRLRNLPVSADFDALRELVDGMWSEAWDELGCSVAIMFFDDVMSFDGLRLNMATYLWHGLHAFDHEETPPRNDEAPSYEERLRRVEEDSFRDLRNLPSPKWRAWYADTWTDRVAIHDTLLQCGVEATSHLGEDLRRAGYTFESDVSRMSIEELVIRLEARHRFFAAAFRSIRPPVGVEPGAVSGPATFAPKRVPTRPPNWNAIMETVAQLKGENVRWKDIRDRVQAAYGYSFDSEDALRKHFERWQKAKRPAG
jgi:hypothetical protein